MFVAVPARRPDNLVMARHERRDVPERARMKRSWFAVLWACVWGGFSLVFMFMAVAQWTGLDPAWDPDVALGAAGTAIFTAAISAAGVIMARSRRVKLAYPPDLSSVAPPHVRVEKRFRLPGAKSAARQPMVDLAEAEAGLAEL